jgi:NAD(P) transhydrogenase subunit beta
MAVAQAQHALREMADKLKKKGVEVKYAIHPVAGRMPGHMNVLLAEANVPYDEVFELEDINSEFARPTSPSSSAPTTSPTRRPRRQVLADLRHADPGRRQGQAPCLFVKRSHGSGYAGIDNDAVLRTTP